MNLNAAGVMELSAVEMREVDGGGILKFFAVQVFIKTIVFNLFHGFFIL